MIENFWVLFAVIALVLILLGVVFWGIYIGRKRHGGMRGIEFDPKELRRLSPRTKAILLKHKDEILKILKP